MTWPGHPSNPSATSAQPHPPRRPVAGQHVHQVDMHVVVAALESGCLLYSQSTWSSDHCTRSAMKLAKGRGSRSTLALSSADR